eukprot:SM000290S10894  [mRNA]  locus=s290:36225:39180:+ [translate_table: standard]
MASRTSYQRFLWAAQPAHPVPPAIVRVSEDGGDVATALGGGDDDGTPLLFNLRGILPSSLGVVEGSTPPPPLAPQQPPPPAGGGPPMEVQELAAPGTGSGGVTKGSMAQWLAQASNGYIHIHGSSVYKREQLASAAAFVASQQGNVSAAERFTAEAAKTEPLGKDEPDIVAGLYPYLQYQGGELYTTPFNIYVIYYGSWKSDQRQIIRRFVDSIGTRLGLVLLLRGMESNPYIDGVATVRGWWDINVNYYQNYNGTRVTANVTYAADIADIRKIVAHATNDANQRSLPLDPGGAYMVLTSPDVYVQDSCYVYCGYHTSAPINGMKLAYAWIGNPITQCPIYCTFAQIDITWVPPNGDRGVDAVVNMFAHELAEIATNPFHGPKDTPSYCVKGTEIENADLCEWTYGPISYSDPPEKAYYNLVGANNTKYLVQLNWNRRHFKCVINAGPNWLDT